MKNIIDITNKLFLDAKEVSEILGISIKTVYAYVAKGILKPYYFPSVEPSKTKTRNKGFYRFRIEEVQRFIDNLPSGQPLERSENVL